jgi:hypothetical protein
MKREIKMKTSKHYMEMVGHAAITNSGGNPINIELQGINTTLGGYSGSPRTKTSAQFAHEYLTNEIDMYDLAKSFNYERDIIFNGPDFDKESFLSEVFFHLQDPIIADARIKEGFNVGLIDTVNNAFLKNDRGWINDKQEVILPSDASIEQLTEHIRSYARIAPTLTIQELEQCEEDGKCYLHDKLIASKNENGDWVDIDTNKTFSNGELIRLIHHKNDPIAIMAGLPEGNLYHSNVTDSKVPQDTHIIRDGISRQGNGSYMTTSVNEAIKIYGNPYSFEVRGKLLDEHEKELINRDDYKFGHLYESSTLANVYKASLKGKHLSFNEVPSASAILLIAKENGTSQVFAQNWWMKMKSAASTYDVYMHLNEFSNRIIGDGGDCNTIAKVMGAMGYQGLEINFPSKEDLTSYQEKITELEEKDESYFKNEKLAKKPVIEEMKAYLKDITEAIPAKAESSHVIIFDPTKVDRVHLSILPLNKKVLGKEDKFYSRDADITLDDIGFGSKENYLLI